MPDPNSIDTLELEQIQGNILGGFNKDFQTFLFLNFPDQNSGREWLATVINDVATSDEVLTFNKLFKKIRSRQGEEGVVKATWMNIAFSFRGLQRLGAAGLNSFPQAFRDGMAARAQGNGDVQSNAPGSWVGQFRTPQNQNIHAMMIIASDTPEDLDQASRRYREGLTQNGVGVVFTQQGRTRMDVPGQVANEHFGFRDGVSQPGIRGVTDTHPDAEPGEGNPGQKLIHPGEFVIGYSKQDGQDAPQGDPNADAASAPPPNPGWTRNGSYLVYRRLRQDVKGFNDFVAQQQAALDGTGERLTTEMGANLVGRYRSGCPFETVESLPNFDPLKGDPLDPDSENHDVPNLKEQVLKDEHINNFRYAHDPQGFLVPRAAHVRKVYPRDAETPGGGEADTQTRRILRRGITFGASFIEGSPSGSPNAANVAFPNDRGLNFLCYQTNIQEQFEFIQRSWVNSPSFPNLPERNNGNNDGHDPIISQNVAGREFTLPITESDVPHLTGIPRWVTTTGGEYFFQPSIEALCQLAGLSDSDEVECRPGERLLTHLERLEGGSS